MTAWGCKSASEVQTWALFSGNTSTSRASSRLQTAASFKPSGTIVGKSFSEWTATSTRWSSRASSSSFVNTPLPPITESGSVFTSPVVLIISMRISLPGLRKESCALTHSAWTRASFEPREPMMIGLIIGLLVVNVLSHDVFVFETKTLAPGLNALVVAGAICST